MDQGTRIPRIFRWHTLKHHFIALVKDGDQELVVAKYWRRSRWEYVVIPTWLYFEAKARGLA